MNVLAWNCRGVGNPRTVRELAAFVQSHDPKLVFLSETRQSEEQMKVLRWRLGLKGCLARSSLGRSGGIALFWDESLKVDLITITNKLIDIKVQESPSAIPWRISFIYGEPRAEDRHLTWELLKRIRLRSDRPWVIMGDFNEVMWQFEHFSETRRNERRMEAFRDVLAECDMHDLGFTGLPWTYDNMQTGRRNVRVRLDRAVATSSWSNMFEHAALDHLVSPCSDHCPILLRSAPVLHPREGGRLLRYEIMWEREESLTEVVEEAWSSARPGADLGSVARALKEVMVSLQEWSKSKFGSIRKKLKELRDKLNAAQSGSDSESREEAKKIAAEMNEVLYREEMMWLQRSRISWLKEGDRNTKFFHRKAVWRSRKNKIKKLKADNGQWCDDPAGMAGMASHFFQNLYKKDDHVTPDHMVNMFSEKVTAEMNDLLCRDFTDEEISNALFQIGPLKAPGPDGFPARFFQRNWGIIKTEVTSAVRAFFKDGVMPGQVNDTAIVLIPKIPHPESLSDFRPISLCDVLYKVVSKCLVNRLRPILHDIISPSQSAFVPGRMITDNAIIAFECLHAIHNSSSARTNFCAYKLDLSKAYDRVDWSFLEKVQLKLGFHRIWVRWIMSCVSSVRFSIRFNGVPTNSFTPTRGLRQGDPLSPYLFLFVADALSMALQNEIVGGNLEALKITRAAPEISHLLFADDALLFFKANVAQAHCVKEVIRRFEHGTGQLLSPSKCSILVRESLSAEVKGEICNVLGVERAQFEAKYLGLPTPDGRLKDKRFQPLKEKFAKRMAAWTEKLLSSAGKEVQIKSVAQAIPTYIMSVFQLSAATCEELERGIRNFWWGAQKGQRKTHWIAWEKFTRSKDRGGLGFRDLQTFNQALLARQAWRILAFPDSLCARLLKARYFPNGDLLDTAFPASVSPTWKAIMFGLELLKKGVIWRVGNGKQIKIWRHAWIPKPHSLRPGRSTRSCRLKWVH